MLLSALLLAPGAGAVTRVEAERAALRALKVRQGTKPVVVFRLRAPLARGTTIGEGGTARPAKVRPQRARHRRQRIRNAAGVAVVRLPVVARVGAERAWFFYEDQGPYQAYQHPGRVVLVGERTGRVRVSRTLRWAPLVNGRLPVFLALNPAYLDSRYRAFAREWSLPRALRTPPLARAAVADPGALSKARELLAREASCFVRISDTVGTMYDSGPVESAEVGLSGFFVRLGLRNSPSTYRYSIFSGATPTGYIERRLIRRERCRDVFVYVAGGGFRAGAGAINIGNRALPGGRSEQQNLAAADLRRMIARNPGVTFKLKVDAPYSGDLLSGLRGLRNLLIFEAAAPGDQTSFEYLPPLGGEGPSVRRRLAFTARQLAGLERFLADPREVDHAAAAVAMGRAPSFMAWMLARGFALGADEDLAEDLGVPPQIHTFGFTPDGPNPPPNRAPSAKSQSVSVTEDEPKEIVLTGSDPDGDVLTFDVTSGPTHGSLSGSGASRTYTPDANYSGPDSFTFSASDGRGATATGTVTIDVKSENDPPVVSTSPGTTTYTEQDDPGAVIDGALTVADVDDAQLEGATVRVAGGYQFGDRLDFVDQAGIAGSYDSGTGVLTLTGNASLGDYQEALRSVRYRYTGDNPAADKLVEFRADDGDSTGPVANKALAVTGVNDAPEIDTTSGALAYSEGEGPVPVDDGLDVADPDSPLQGAVVQITSNFVSVEDELAFANQSGISGSYNDATGALTLTGTASVADYRSALRSVTYENSANNPSGATRTVSFQVTDTAGASSNVDTRDVNVSPSNDEPVLDNSPGATSYTEGGAPVAVDSALTVADEDDTNLESADVRISVGFQSGDSLEFVDQAGITGAYNTGTGVLTLTGTASKGDYQTALRSIKFSHTGDDPQGAKSVQFKVNDGDADSESDTKTIDIAGVNDAPILDTTDAALAYSENGGAVPVDGGLTLSDPDSAQMAGAVVQITSNFASAEDDLTFTNQSGISGSYDDATGTLTLTGAASRANYQTALRAVRYANTSDDPSTATRTVSFQVSDGSGANSNVATRDVTPSKSNDAPTVTTSAGSASYTEGGSAATVDNALTASDPDDTNFEGGTVRISSGFQSGDGLVFVNQAGITGAYNTGTGVLTLSGTAPKADYQAALRSIQFQTTNDAPVTSKTVEFKLNDGAADSNAATKNVAVTPGNDAPSLTTSPGSAGFVENAGDVAVDPGLVATDPDSANLAGATVQITSNFASAEDDLLFTDQSGITGSYDDATGALTLSGSATVADYQAALRTVRYVNTSDEPSTATRTVSFRVDDGAGASNLSNVATRDVTVTAANDAPTVTTSAGDTAYQEGGSAATVDGALTVADPDDTNFEGATVRISSNFQSGDHLVFVNQAGITGLYDSGTGVLTLSGTAPEADYQAALRSIQFQTTNDGPTASKTVEFKVNDGAADSNAATKDLAIAQANDGPTIGSGGTLAYTENDPATAVHSTLTVVDTESDPITEASATISNNFQSGEDTLIWNDNDVTDNISEDVGNSTNQTIALTGQDSAANYQAALRAVTYVNASESPTTPDRTVTFSATDLPGAVGSDTRTISVTSVDDPPVAVDDSATVLEDAAATSVAVLSNDTDKDAGPMTIASATDPANGAVVLTGGSPGAHTGLTYQPDPNYCNDPPGTTPDTFTYSLNEGSTATVSMTVTCVNDAPVADNETFDGNDSAHGNTTMVVDDPDDGAPTPAHPKTTVTGDILAGDTDVDGPAPLTVEPGTIATDDGGSVTVESDGDFIFHPAAGASCTDTSDFFDYVVKDSGTPAASDTGRVTIAVAGCVWYVDNQAAAGGGGTSSAPFDTLAEAETASGANHTVFVYDGDNTDTDYDTGYALAPGERLIGEHEGLTVDPDQGGALTADTLHPSNAGAHPTLSAVDEDVIALDDGNEVRGFVIDPEGAGGGIAGGSGDTGGGTVDDVNVVDSGTVGTQPGLDLDGTTGTFDISDFTVDNDATGVRLSNAGTVQFAPAGTIELDSNGAPALDAFGTGLGTSAFDEIVSAGSSTGGVSLVNTTGNTTFGDGTGTDLALATTSGSAPAFRLASAGTASVGAAGTDNATAVGGPAVDVSGTTISALDFDEVSSTNSATDGINLANLGSGTFSAASGAIAGAQGISFDLDGGSGAVTYPGPLGNGTGQAAEITGRTGGAVTLSGQVSDTSDAGGGIRVSSNTGGSTLFSNSGLTVNTTTPGSPSQNDAIVMSASDGHTLTLSGGGLNVDTTTGKGLDADASGTLAVTGSGNTIDTTTGRALNVANTDIAASKLTFERVSSNGATSGIALVNTGSAGGLTVSGTGAPNSGGQIQNATGDGISMANVGGGVSLSNMSVNNNGNAVGEHGFDLADVTGTVALNSLTASANAEDNLHLVNNSGTLNLTVSGGSFSNTASNAATGNDGIYLEGTGTGSMTASIQNVTLTNNRGDHVQLNTDNSNTVTQNLTVNNGNLDANPATSNGGGIAVTPGGGANVDATLTNNDIQGADSSAVVVDTTSGSATFPTTATVDTTITANTIGTAGSARSGSFGGNGMQIVSNGASVVNALVTGNQVREYTNAAGIRLSQGDGTNAQLRATVRDNTIAAPNGALGGANGVYVTAGITSTPSAGGGPDAGTMCLDLGGGSGSANFLAGSGSGGAGFEDIFVWQRQSVKVQLPGLGATTTDAAAASYLQARNNGNGTPSVYTESTPANTGFLNTSSCPLPS